jgi:hypothetical protein
VLTFGADVSLGGLDQIILSSQLPISHTPAAPLHTPERVQVPHELHHYKERYILEHALECLRTPPLAKRPTGSAHLQIPGMPLHRSERRVQLRRQCPQLRQGLAPFGQLDHCFAAANRQYIHPSRGSRACHGIILDLLGSKQPYLQSMMFNFVTTYRRLVHKR